MKQFFSFQPKLIQCLKTYNKSKFTADLMAGIIVGIVALPLAIAFGIASGVSPEKGIITAIVAGLAISLFGGSRVQIGGPTGALAGAGRCRVRSGKSRSSFLIHQLNNHEKYQLQHRFAAQQSCGGELSEEGLRSGPVQGRDDAD